MGSENTKPWLWKPGAASPNPGGRPKGIRAQFKKRFGQNGEALAEFAHAILEGTAKVTEVVMVKDSEGATYPQEVEVGPSLRDKIEVLKVALAYGFGKPPQAIEISGPDGGPIPTCAVDVDRYSLAELTHLAELLEKGAPALPAADVVEGEVVDTDPEE